MRFVLFFVVTTLTIALTVFLNIRYKSIPPLGKFLNPYNGVWRNSEDIKNVPKQLIFEDLNEPVTVVYDKNLIPRIFAENEQDLYFAQGYVVASNRLWQMEIITHFAAGRLSEIFGKERLENDRFIRRKGLPYGALMALGAMEQDTSLYKLINSFSKGVNAYISTLEYKTLPLEYKLLHYEPEEWTPYKSALLLKYMAENLSRSENDLHNTNALSIYGKDTFDLLFPNRQPADAPIIPKGTKWNFKPVQIPKKDLDYFKKFINKDYPQPDPDNGSNNWAINSTKTAGGAPLLANDIHLELFLPNIWFLMQLTTPEKNVFGGTLPGALGIITGFNDSIAWGVTNAKQDVVDWYRIKFRNHTKEEYQYDEQWLKTEKIIEKFEIRDEEPFYDTIVHTHYGPIVFDENFQPDHGLVNFAMRWTAHDPSLEQKTFYLLNHANNYQDFTDALSYYDTPAQNFIFASKKKEVAIHVNGKFPLKWHEQGKFLLDGSNSSHEWQGFIPREHLPKAYNPNSNFLFSANQHPVDSLYPYYVYDYFYEDFRNRRLLDRLSKMNKVRVIDMMNLQNDNFSYKASLSLPILLSKLDTIQLNDSTLMAYRLLTEWDYLNNPDKKAPAIYETWWEIFKDILWDEFNIQTIRLSKPDDFTTIRLISTNPQFYFYDIMLSPENESLENIVNLSFQKTLDSLSKWEKEKEMSYFWGNYKSTSAMHMLGLPSLSRENIQIGGNRGSVNATARRHGVSLRIITELQENSKSWVIYPGGQSGNPGSRFYDNFINQWRDGKYIEIQFMQNPNDRSNNILFVQQFTNNLP